MSKPTVRGRPLVAIPPYDGALSLNGSRNRNCLSAVDHDRRADHESTRIRGEQQQGTIEIACCAESTERYGISDGGALGARQKITIEIGYDPPRRNGVDPNALRCPFKPHHPGQLYNA